MLYSTYITSEESQLNPIFALPPMRVLLGWLHIIVNPKSFKAKDSWHTWSWPLFYQTPVDHFVDPCCPLLLLFENPNRH